MSDPKGNVWHAAHGILVSYLMSMLFQGGIRTWSGVILSRRVLKVSGQTQVKAVLYKRVVSLITPIIMVPAWHPVGTEVHNLGRWQIFEFNQAGWVDFVDLFADFTFMLQLLISARPFYKETNNNTFLRRNQSARCFIGCV